MAESYSQPDDDDPAEESASSQSSDSDTPSGATISRTGRSLTAGLLVLLLGFTLVVQIRSHASDDNLAAARTEDLVRILSDLDSQRARLSEDIDELNADRDELSSGSQSSAAALRRAEELADSVEILAGTAPATGPGLQLTFTPDADGTISSAVMLDAVEELRGAGAEAMQVDGDNDEAVRIVAASYFADEDDKLVVDEVTLEPAYTLTVIGDPDTMSTAIDIPGGVADTVKKDGGTVDVAEPGTVNVSALATLTPPEYAEPVD